MAFTLNVRSKFVENCEGKDRVAVGNLVCGGL